MGKMRIYNFIAAWTDLADGVVGILTLGFYRPGWDYRLMLWHSKKALVKKIKNDAVNSTLRSS